MKRMGHAGTCCHTYRTPDIMMYMILELVSSTSYNTILYEQPVPLNQIIKNLSMRLSKEFLYNIGKADDYLSIQRPAKQAERSPQSTYTKNVSCSSLLFFICTLPASQFPYLLLYVANPLHIPPASNLSIQPDKIPLISCPIGLYGCYRLSVQQQITGGLCLF